MWGEGREGGRRGWGEGVREGAGDGGDGKQVRIYNVGLFGSPCFLGVCTPYDNLPCFGPPRL